MRWHRVPDASEKEVERILKWVIVHHRVPDERDLEPNWDWMIRSKRYNTPDPTGQLLIEIEDTARHLATDRVDTVYRMNMTTALHGNAFTLLTVSHGNQLVPGGFSSQRASNAEYFVVSLTKLLNKQKTYRRLMTPRRSYDFSIIICSQSYCEF